LAAPIGRPPDRLPQLTVHGEQHDVAGVDWSFDAVVTRFWQPVGLRGDRTVVNPSVSYPIVQPGYFVVPKISLHANYYNLINQEPGKKTNPSVVAPSLSIDTGLIFEREVEAFDQRLTQTLEPRLFYVNTPYRDQSTLPVFDTGLADFNFAQIFSENRFVGLDRYGDANQLTAALISRFIEEDGNELAKFAVGQRYNFISQKVSLTNTTDQSRSDLLLAATTKITKTISADGALQISQSDRHSVRSNYNVHWNPAEKTVLNVGYSMQRGTLEQASISTQFSLFRHWSVVGQSNYSLPDRKQVDGLIGFEYRPPCNCWALRMVKQHITTTTLTSKSPPFSNWSLQV